MITTLVPTLPLVGVNLVMVGVTLKLVELVAEPPLVVTVILPVLQAVGMVNDHVHGCFRATDYRATTARAR